MMHQMEKIEQIESNNQLDGMMNPEQQTGGGAFYQCGVKECNKNFVGKKKDETAKNELLPHIKEVHQEVWMLIQNQGSQQDIIKLITKNYLKKSRREQKKNYYCKVCPKTEDGDFVRFSQVENVHQRSGLEAHVKRQHPEYWENSEQEKLKKENQIKWMNQWCGYDGPAKTKGGRPNKKFIIEKYNTENDELKMESQLDSEDEKFFQSIGIDVQRNKSIGTEEYQKHLEISHELFNNKDKIQAMQEPLDMYNEVELLNLFQMLDEEKRRKFENLLHLIRNQKGEDENQYPENSKSKISEIIRISLITVYQNMFNAQFPFSQGQDYQLIVNDLKNVQLSFQEFVESLQKNNDE